MTGPRRFDLLGRDAVFAQYAGGRRHHAGCRFDDIGIISKWPVAVAQVLGSRFSNRLRRSGGRRRRRCLRLLRMRFCQLVGRRGGVAICLAVGVDVGNHLPHFGRCPRLFDNLCEHAGHRSRGLEGSLFRFQFDDFLIALDGLAFALVPLADHDFSDRFPHFRNTKFLHFDARDVCHEFVWCW